MRSGDFRPVFLVAQLLNQSFYSYQKAAIEGINSPFLGTLKYVDVLYV
jgi:hypothetical protein